MKRASSEKYLLRYPVEHADGTVAFDTVTIRRPKARDLPVLDSLKISVGEDGLHLGSLGSAFVAIAKQLTDLSPNVIDSLELEDVAGISKILMGFFGMSLPDGNVSLVTSGAPRGDSSQAS